MTVESIAPTRGNRAGHGRLQEVDALRGLAALAVVFYHYLDRHQETIGHVGEPLFWFPWGQNGVQLFFVISGFVIFMTLDRTTRPMDFVVSRVSRLYPVYWAAMFVTIGAVLISGIPNYRPESWSQIAVNLTMWHKLFRIEDIEGAYWTLYVELWFYVAMLILFASGQLRRIEVWLLVALAGAWFWWLGGQIYGVFGWSARLTAVFGRVIPEVAFFVIGICIYRLHRNQRPAQALLVMMLALITVAIHKGRIETVVAVIAMIAFALIIAGRAGLLRQRLLVWLGAISYSLYLIHNYAGRSIIAGLQDAGWSTNSSLVVTALLALGGAALLTFLVERPAQRAIRAWWSRRRGAAEPAAAI